MSTESTIDAPEDGATPAVDLVRGMTESPIAPQPPPLYAATHAFTAIWFTALRWYASRHLLDDQLSPHAVSAMDRRYVAGALMYVIALGLAFLSPATSLIFVALLALRFLIPDPAVARSKKEASTSRSDRLVNIGRQRED